MKPKYWIVAGMVMAMAGIAHAAAMDREKAKQFDAAHNPGHARAGVAHPRKGGVSVAQAQRAAKVSAHDEQVAAKNKAAKKHKEKLLIYNRAK